MSKAMVMNLKILWSKHFMFSQNKVYILLNPRLLPNFFIFILIYLGFFLKYAEKIEKLHKIFRNNNFISN